MLGPLFCDVFGGEPYTVLFDGVQSEQLQIQVVIGQGAAVRVQVRVPVQVHDLLAPFHRRSQRSADVFT